MLAPPTEQRWLLVRESPLGPGEVEIVDRLSDRLRRRGVVLETVLLGTAAYEADRAGAGGASPTPAAWVLEDDAKGRGLRSPGDRPFRSLSYDELVDAVMTAERVISLA